MPSDESLRRAEELLPTKGVTSRSWASCTRYYRLAVAAALDAAREQGREKERERWRRRVAAEAARLDRWAQEGSVDQRATRLAGATLLRSLLSAPAEVAGQEEG